MVINKNQTLLRGTIRAIRPRPDGWGAEVELDVLENDSPSRSSDFLRPARGSVLTGFLSKPEDLHVGDRVRVEASLAGGPFGGRTILQSVELDRS